MKREACTEGRQPGGCRELAPTSHAPPWCPEAARSPEGGPGEVPPLSFRRSPCHAPAPRPGDKHALGLSHAFAGLRVSVARATRAAPLSSFPGLGSGVSFAIRSKRLEKSHPPPPTPLGSRFEGWVGGAERIVRIYTGGMSPDEDQGLDTLRGRTATAVARRAGRGEGGVPASRGAVRAAAASRRSHGERARGGAEKLAQ